MAEPAHARSVDQLMAYLRQGKREAAGELVELLYPELKRLAAAKMKGERADHTWQPTALVNELYLELVKVRGLESREGQGRDEKRAFIGLAAHMMMRLLVHHARPLYRRAEKVPASEGNDPRMAVPADLDHVETLLASLSEVDPELRTIVEMKVFEGLSVEEIADQLGCSPRTVSRRWYLAKQWLANELERG